MRITSRVGRTTDAASKMASVYSCRAHPGCTERLGGPQREIFFRLKRIGDLDGAIKVRKLELPLGLQAETFACRQAAGHPYQNAQRLDLRRLKPGTVLPGLPGIDQFPAEHS